tara:strand:- start:378 stop:527 length:150 start_codon:yes stop_codon:yes gene_type:complete
MAAARAFAADSAYRYEAFRRITKFHELAKLRKYAGKLPESGHDKNLQVW